MKAFFAGDIMSSTLVREIYFLAEKVFDTRGISQDQLVPSLHTAAAALPARPLRVAGARVAHLATGNGSVATSNATAMTLPPAWRPGLSVSSGDDARGCAVEVLYELPDSNPAHHAAPDAPGASLPCPARVEPGSASVQLFSDHMSVRLPLLHPGTALPERKLRAGRGGAAEGWALRSAAGRRLACNMCRGALSLQPGATATGAAGGGGAPAPHAPLRAHLLPSEHWMEWSDLWVCHGDEHNAFASAGDFGTLRGAILVGEQHLQLHPRDVDPESVVLRFALLEDRNAVGADAADAEIPATVE